MNAAAAAAPEEEEKAGPVGAEGQGAPPPLPRVPGLDRAGLLKRRFKQEVLECERCGGRRWVVANLRHLPVVRQVLVHLKLPADGPPLAPVHAAPQPDFWLEAAALTPPRPPRPPAALGRGAPAVSRSAPPLLSPRPKASRPPPHARAAP